MHRRRAGRRGPVRGHPLTRHAALLALGLAACAAPTSSDHPPSAAHAALRNSDGSRRTFPPAPADVPGVAVVVPYAAFGPQVLAAELLGMEAYAFGDAHCCYAPDDTFDIRVVVTRDAAALAMAKARYPSGPALGDYRFVLAADARAYIASAIVDATPPVVATLRALAARLDQAFAAT